MEKIKLNLLLIILMATSFSASAYDFMYDGIAFNINEDGNTLTVTYERKPIRGRSSYSSYPTGEILQRVIYNGKSYKVTAIGDSAFVNVWWAFNIPNTVTYIGEYAFYGSVGSGTLYIPDNVTYIGDWAFHGCLGLNGTLTIPSSVTTIGDYAFSNCRFETIRVDNNNPNYDSRNNSNAIIETKTNRLLSGCMNTIIPETVTSIAEGAFYDIGLTSLTIPNSVTAIGDEAFNYSGLTSVTIGNSVSSIGDYAFAGCSKLTIINNHIDHPSNVTLGENVFEDVSKTNCTLYVNNGRVEEYQNASQWKEFENIQDGDWEMLVSEISLDCSELQLEIGHTQTLTATITPDNVTNKNVTWQSSNTSVATVSSEGEVSAISAGAAIITATTTDGSDLNAICLVIVSGANSINGDVNGDGIVDVTDVSTVIDIILGKH